ncbi:MAG: hypothetical protein LBO72_01925, partial [Helicobacteraceae bacterium]|nr:hypothetical protein [Helicobacteraceae bacterium]
MTFLQLAEKVLREANKPLTPKEIWDFGDKKGYAKEVRTSGLTPWETIGARIYVDIRDNEKTKFIKVGKKSLFFLTDLIKNENTVKYETDKEYSDNNDNDDYDEKDLHKFLTYHVYSKYKIYTKTISAQKSLKKEKNSDKWRHPDIVGVYFP